MKAGEQAAKTIAGVAHRRVLKSWEPSVACLDLVGLLIKKNNNRMGAMLPIRWSDDAHPLTIHQGANDVSHMPCIKQTL